MALRKKDAATIPPSWWAVDGTGDGRAVIEANMHTRHFPSCQATRGRCLLALALAFSSGCRATSGASSPSAAAGRASFGERADDRASGDPAVARSALLAELRSGGAVLRVFGESIVVRAADRQLLALRLPLLNDAAPEAVRLRESGPQSLSFEVQYPARVDFLKGVDDDEARVAALRITAVEGGFRMQSKPEWGRRTTLELEDEGQHYFGVSEGLQPDNRPSPDLSGRSVGVEVASEGQQIQENYASAFSAFFMSSAGYGSFFDTFARGRYEFGVNGKTRLHHDTGTLDWYLFIGDQGADVHRSYFQVIGAPKFVPAWALGPVGWRDQNDGGAAEILADVKQMSELRIPLTAWFVDRPYSDGAHAWSKMNFSSAFAQPARWIRQLREEHGLSFMTWTAAATFGDLRFDKHLPGKFSYVDLSHEQSAEAFGRALARQYEVGVRGHKIDRGDEHLPYFEDTHDGTPLAEQRNTYVYRMLKVHDDALRQVWGEDQFTFARAAIHRSQPFLSAIWAGDPRSTWEGLRANYANAARSAFLGFPVWGTDVGGYLGEGLIPEPLYVRWLEAGSMSGLFEIKLDGAGGSGRDRLPWRYPAVFQDRFRRICEDRMRFLPHLYSLANSAATRGTVMQPMAYRDLLDDRAWAIWDQFYVGDLLVAPVLSPELERSVYFPPGNWKDIDDPLRTLRGGERRDIAAPLDKLPRFIRDGSLFVTGDVYRGNGRRWLNGASQLQIHAYPASKAGTAQFLYVDMHESNAEKIIRLQSTPDEVVLTVPGMTHAVQLQLYLEREPRAVLLNDAKVEAAFDAATGILSVDASVGGALRLAVSR